MLPFWLYLHSVPNMVSPYSIQQQQLAFLSQQQALLMATTNSGVAPPMITFNIIQPGINVSNAHSEGLLSQTRPSLAFVTPGMTLVDGQNGLNKSQTGNIKRTYSASYGYFSTPSMYPMNYSSAPINGGVSIGRTVRLSSPAASSATATQSGKE